jgi:uncharacterized membrane protein (UPF0127 family)
MLRNRFLISLISAMLVLVVLPVASTSAQSVPWREELQLVREETAIMVGDDVLTVELSVTISQQTLGLGYRNGLENGTGMLFVNESATPRSFWMLGMRFCIDIVWIEDGEITGAAESVCPEAEGTEIGDYATYRSCEPVTFVLEVPAGWLEQRNYGAGTLVQIPEELLPEETASDQDEMLLNSLLRAACDSV